LFCIQYFIRHERGGWLQPPPNMNEQTSNNLPALYQAALRNHLESASHASLRTAQPLGEAALTLRLETLDLAKIHEQAMTKLVLAKTTSDERLQMEGRGAHFFYATILPILKGRHESALNAVRETLEQRQLELEDARREMKRQIAGRESEEEALRQSLFIARQLVQESVEMKERLQTMTHQILAAHEEERKMMSLQLQDEIAQTLLGIHVRLLALKKEAADSSASLAQEIATIQQLVEQSVEAIHRYATEIGIAHEEPI
jgi:signal transduction histidine kinase